MIEFLNSLWAFLNPHVVGSEAILPALLAAAAIPSLYKIGSGIGQKIKSNKINPNRPIYNPSEYQIPPEVKQYLSMTQNRLVDPRLPGQQATEDKLGAVTSNAAFDIGATGGGLNAISSIYGKQMDETAGLGIKAAENYQEQKLAKENAVANALQYSAGQNAIKQNQDLQRSDKMFDYNQNQPYQKDINAKGALTQAANTNLFNGIDSLSTLGSMYLMDKGDGNGGSPDVKAPATGTGSSTIPYNALSSVSPTVAAETNNNIPDRTDSNGIVWRWDGKTLNWVRK